MKTVLGKWLICVLGMTVLLSPIELVLAGLPFDSPQGRIRLGQTVIIAILIFLKHHQYVDKDDGTMLAHGTLLTMHFTFPPTSELNVAIVMLIHSFLPTRYLEMDLLTSLSLPFARSLGGDLQHMLCALPAIMHVMWLHFTSHGVTFSKNIEDNYTHYQNILRFVALCMTGILLVPVLGMYGLLLTFVLVAIITFEITVLIPFLKPMVADPVLVGYVTAVMLAYSCNLVLLPSSIGFDESLFHTFQCIKTIPSMKLALHRPGVLSHVNFFAVDLLEMIFQNSKYTLSIPTRVYAIWIVVHIMAELIVHGAIYIMEMKLQMQNLIETNNALATHCTITTRDCVATPSHSTIASRPQSPILETVDKEAAEAEAIRCNSGHSGTQFDGVFEEQRLMIKDDDSSSGRHSVPSLRTGDTSRLNSMMVNRLTRKLIKLSDKIEAVAAGDQVSSESSFDTASSAGRVKHLEMQLQATKEKMDEMIRVISNHRIGACDALSELQRSIGVEQTVAYGVLLPTALQPDRMTRRYPSPIETTRALGADTNRVINSLNTNLELS